MGYQIWQCEDVTWVDVLEPTRADIERLEEQFPQLHPLALEDCLSPSERPKMDEFADHLFLVMQFPVWGEQLQVKHYGEIDLFIGKHFVVTAHSGELAPFQAVASSIEEDEAQREALLGRGAGHLSHALLDGLVDDLLFQLSKLDTRVRQLADEIFAADARRVLREILRVRRDLISSRRIIRSQVEIIASLEEGHHEFITEELDEYFGDLLDHLTKALDLVVENLEFIDSLADTADTLVSQRINDVMRTLTVISVIMLPLTLITGFYGMNVPIPLQKEGAVFWLIVAVMGLVVVGMLSLFRRKDWL